MWPKSFPSAGDEMAHYLAAGANVVIEHQNEVGDALPFSITVAGTNFWVNTTIEEARTLASGLGLRVLGRSDVRASIVLILDPAVTEGRSAAGSGETAARMSRGNGD
jgi:hypothetical protein